MSQMKIVYKQFYDSTEWYINIVLATNNMFSLSKVKFTYLKKAIEKYIDFMISSSMPFTIMELLDLFML